jgi:hypothetical protein
VQEEDMHQLQPSLAQRIDHQHEQQIIASRPQDQQTYSQNQQIQELQLHIQHQQASHDKVITLNETLHGFEVSRLKRQVKDLQEQLDIQPRRPLQQQVNQQQRYQPMRYQPQQQQQQRYQTDDFNPIHQDQNQPPSYQPGMKSNDFMMGEWS